LGDRIRNRREAEVLVTGMKQLLAVEVTGNDLLTPSSRL